MKTRKYKFRVAKIKQICESMCILSSQASCMALSDERQHSLMKEYLCLPNMSMDAHIQTIDLTLDDVDSDDDIPLMPKFLNIPLRVTASTESDDDNDVLIIDCDETELDTQKEPTETITENRDNSSLVQSTSTHVSLASNAQDDDSSSVQHDKIANHLISFSQSLKAIGGKLITTRIDTSANKPIYRHTIELTTELADTNTGPSQTGNQSSNNKNVEYSLAPLIIGLDRLAQTRDNGGDVVLDQQQPMANSSTSSAQPIAPQSDAATSLLLTPSPYVQQSSTFIDIQSPTFQPTNPPPLTPVARIFCGNCGKIYEASDIRSKCSLCYHSSSQPLATNDNCTEIEQTSISNSNQQAIIVTVPTDFSANFTIPFDSAAVPNVTAFTTNQYATSNGTSTEHQSQPNNAAVQPNPQINFNDSILNQSLYDYGTTTGTTIDSTIGNATQSDRQTVTALMYTCQMCNKLYDALQSNFNCPNCLPILDGTVEANPLVYIQDGNNQILQDVTNLNISSLSTAGEMQVPSDLDMSCFLDANVDFINEVADNFIAVPPTEETEQAQTLASYFGFFDSNVEEFVPSAAAPLTAKSPGRREQPPPATTEVSVVLWKCDPLIKKRAEQKRKREKIKRSLAKRKEQKHKAASEETRPIESVAESQPAIPVIKLKRKGKDMSKFRPEDWEIIFSDSEEEKPVGNDYVRLSCSQPQTVKATDLPIINVQPSECPTETKVKKKHPTTENIHGGQSKTKTNLQTFSADLLSIVTPPSAPGSVNAPDTPDTGYRSGCVWNSEVLPVNEQAENVAGQCVAEAQQQQPKRLDCDCGYASIRHVKNDVISISTQSVGCAKCTKRRSDDDNLRRTSIPQAATSFQSSATKRRSTITAESLMAGPSSIHQLTDSVGHEHLEQRIIAGSSPNRPPNDERKTRTLSTDSDCLSITMSDDFSFSQSPNSKRDESHINESIPTKKKTNSLRSNRENTHLNKTNSISNNPHQSIDTDIRNESISVPMDPSKIVIRLVNDSLNKCTRFVAAKVVNATANQNQTMPSQIIDRSQLLVRNNFVPCSQPLNGPAPTHNAMDYNRVLSTPFEPPQIQNVNLSKINLNPRASMNGLAVAPSQNCNQRNALDCFVIPSTSTTKLLHSGTASSASRYIESHALKLFNSPCYRFLNNYCTRTNCVYGHSLPDPSLVLTKLSGFPSDLLTRVYDSFVLKHFKIFVTYFPTFATVFGRQKCRDKLIAMIGDCESAQRNCVQFFKNIFDALCECNLTSSQALRFLLCNRKSTTAQTTNVLMHLILKTNVFDFLDVLQEFSCDENYSFENVAIANLMRLSLQAPQRFDLIRTLMLILQRRNASRFWEYDANLYVAFLKMVDNANLANGCK